MTPLRQWTSNISATLELSLRIGMNFQGFTTPILITFWKRHSTAIRVISKIREHRPQTIFLACDGPRENNEEDSRLIEEARTRIESAIDWPCTIKRRYSSCNQGSKHGMANAIGWFFSEVEEGIVLEDDCLPSATFLPFCHELLSRFRHDTRIWQIAGTNHLGSWPASEHSYLFSGFSLGWGWASWRRCWQHYDPNLQSWPELRSSSIFANAFEDRQQLKYWKEIFDRLYDFGFPETWDYQWTYAGLCQGALSIVPRTNQISNIGFGASGTYCTSEENLFATLDTAELDAIRHPPTIIRDCRYDQELIRKIIKAEGKGPQTLLAHLRYRLYYTAKYLSRKLLSAGKRE